MTIGAGRVYPFPGWEPLTCPVREGDARGRTGNREDEMSDGSRSAREVWRRAVTRLPEELPAAGRVREFAASALCTWNVSAQTREDVVLVASELVTNAVEHGHGEVTVVLRQGEDGRLVLRVWDDDAHIPVQRGPADDSVRGNGLVIVDAVSRAWGYETAGDGKWVWAEFA